MKSVITLCTELSMLCTASVKTSSYVHYILLTHLLQICGRYVVDKLMCVHACVCVCACARVRVRVRVHVCIATLWQFQTQICYRSVSLYPIPETDL